MKQPWDPLELVSAPSPSALARIKSELCMAFKDPLPGIFVVPDDDNITIVGCSAPWLTHRFTRSLSAPRTHRTTLASSTFYSASPTTIHLLPLAFA
jgi:hypothetical protein